MGVQATLNEMAEAIPGGVASCDLTVRNSGSVSDSFRFEVIGDAAAWARVVPPRLELAPTTEGVVQVVFSLPRAPWPAAGAVPVDVKVLSQAEPRRPALAQGVLRIAPFSESGASLEPRLSHGRRRAQHILTVHNRGNGVMCVGIGVVHADRGLQVDLSSTEMYVPPGRSGSVLLTARRRIPRLWGSGPTGSFNLTIEAAGVSPIAIGGAMHQEVAGWGLRCGAVLGITVVALALAVLVMALG